MIALLYSKNEFIKKERIIGVPMNVSLYLSLFLIVGLLGGLIARRIKLPSVTGYILFGLLMGPSFLNVFSADIVYSFSFVNDIALAFLALAIGGELHWKSFKDYGRDLPKIILGDLFFTFFAVFLPLRFFGMNLEIAVILGILALTVSPSGVVSVIKEYKAKGKLTYTVLTMVAIDNLASILLFSIAIATFESLMVNSTGMAAVIFSVGLELILSVVLGGLIGLIMVYFIRKKLQTGKFLSIILALIFFNTGFAVYLGLSSVLVNIVAGALVSNLTNRSTSIAYALEPLELPIFIVFLTMAGAKLDLSTALSTGIFGLIYIAGRFIGKVYGVALSSKFTKFPKSFGKRLGMGLTPQAGVEIGLSIMAEQVLPIPPGSITTIVLTGIIFFEIVGPLLLGHALYKAGEGSLQ